MSAVDDHVQPNHWPLGVCKTELHADSLSCYDAAVVITDHDNLDLVVLEDTALPVLDTRDRIHSSNVERL